MEQSLTSFPVIYLKESNFLLDFSVPFFATVAGAVIAFLLQYFYEKNKERIKKANRILEVQTQLVFQYEKLTDFYDSMNKQEQEDKTLALKELILNFHHESITDSLSFLGYYNYGICGLLSKSQDNYSCLKRYINKKNEKIEKIKNFQEQEKPNPQILSLMMSEVKMLHYTTLDQAKDALENNILTQKKLEEVARKTFKNKSYHYTKVGFIDIKNIKIINFDELDK